MLCLTDIDVTSSMEAKCKNNEHEIIKLSLALYNGFSFCKLMKLSKSNYHGYKLIFFYTFIITMADSIKMAFCTLFKHTPISLLYTIMAKSPDINCLTVKVNNSVNISNQISKYDITNY